MSSLIRAFVLIFSGKLRRENWPEGGSRYRMAKAFYILRIAARQRVFDLLLIGLGIASAGFGLRSFLLPTGFIDGGITGISLLVARISHFPLPVLIVILNIPFLILAFRQMGRSFGWRCTIAIIGLALAVAIVPYPHITSDKLLVAAFGGFFLGAGIGLAIRGGAVLDGTEVLAIYLGRKSGLTVGDIILILNIAIFLVAAWVLDAETALYAILTYLSAAKTVDFVVEGLEEYIGVTIVSSHYLEIRDMIVEKLDRGITIYAGLRGHGKRGDMRQTEIIFTVVTRLEIAKLRHEVERIDPNAFLAMHSVKDVRGGIIKKRAHEY